MANWNEIPNRWENYTTCGYPIPKTPFVAFKVPLSEELQNRYDEMYPSFLTEAAQEKHKWTLKDLEETLPRLDLIIDLTATERYYNPNNLSGHIMHDKIKTEGNELTVALLQILLGRGIHIDFSSQLIFAKNWVLWCFSFVIHM